MKEFVVSTMDPNTAEPVHTAWYPFTRKGRKHAEFIMRTCEGFGIPARVDVKES